MCRKMQRKVQERWQKKNTTRLHIPVPVHKVWSSHSTRLVLRLVQADQLVLRHTDQLVFRKTLQLVVWQELQLGWRQTLQLCLWQALQLGRDHGIGLVEARAEQGTVQTKISGTTEDKRNSVPSIQADKKNIHYISNQDLTFYYSASASPPLPPSGPPSASGSAPSRRCAGQSPGRGAGAPSAPEYQATPAGSPVGQRKEARSSPAAPCRSPQG